MKSLALKLYNLALRRIGSKKAQPSCTPSDRPSRTGNVFASILSPLEPYLVSVQSLLIWEKPYLSATAFVTVNCLFWFIVSWNRRFYSILCLIFMAFFLYRTWVTQVWPEIRVPSTEEDAEGWTPVHPQVLSVPELNWYFDCVCSKFDSLYREMLKLRETNRGLFCALVCMSLSLFAALGHVVPGILIMYFIVLFITLGPGVALHLIPPTFYDQVAGFWAEITSSGGAAGAAKTPKTESDGDSDLEEFLPESSPEVLRQLSLRQESSESVMPGIAESPLEQSDTENEHMTTIRELGMDSFGCESEESSLYKGLGGFPSLEEEDETDLEDELPDKPEANTPTDEGKNGICFVASHFKESSESESETEFTKDLSFSPIAEEKESPEKVVSKDASEHESSSSKNTVPAPRVSTSSDFDEELMDFEFLEESEISQDYSE